MEEGQKLIFIPAARGIYTPLVLRQLDSFCSPPNESLSMMQATGGINNNNNPNLSNSYSYSAGSFKNNLFLDFDTLDLKFKDLLL